MKAKHPFWYNCRRGQTMVEYVLALVVIALLFGVLWYLVSAASSSAERTTNLVESDYP